jgi:hypothetical protein
MYAAARLISRIARSPNPWSRRAATSLALIELGLRVSLIEYSIMTLSRFGNSAGISPALMELTKSGRFDARSRPAP